MQKDSDLPACYISGHYSSFFRGKKQKQSQNKKLQTILFLQWMYAFKQILLLDASEHAQLQQSKISP